MDMLIILTYSSICIAIFKIFKIPLNKWTVPTAVLGGVAIITAIMLIMNYNHPYAKYGKEYFVTIPIVPETLGTIDAVYIETEKPVNKGDILFTLENSMQTIAYEKALAALEEAKSFAKQQDEELSAATAITAQAKANRDRSKTTFTRFRDGHSTGGENSPFSQQELDNRRKLFEASEATLDAAQANERRLAIAVESKILGENTKVAQLNSAKNSALVELNRTIVRAPVDGTPSQIGLRVGTRVTDRPFGSALTFIVKEKRRFAALFWQNSLLRLKVGLDAEVILDSVPGHVFSGKVTEVLPAMQEGELQGDGHLISGSRLMRHGMAIAIIELDEDLSDYGLPMGVQGQAVVLNYEHDYVHVSMVRRILLRMLSWLKYVYPVK